MKLVQRAAGLLSHEVVVNTRDW